MDGHRPPGLVGIFVRHPTAANLLMALMIVGGLFALDRLNTQFFPDFGIDMVTVQVEWPGASAEDVDANIVQAIEPEVRFLDGVDKVRSVSVEGLAQIAIEYHSGTDMQAALAEAETAVGQVTTLPRDAETPDIRRIVRYDTISRILLSGPYSEAALKTFAKRMRDDLLNRGVDKVDLIGARDEEIWVEASPLRLLELDMTPADVAARIASVSQDIPSGATGGAAQRQVRSLGLEKHAEGVGQIEVLARPTGAALRVADLGAVSEAFDENQAVVRRHGRTAIELHVRRAVSGDALEAASRVDRYLADTLPTLPPDLTVEQYDIQADLIRSRISLLLENGLSGLVLVVAILFLFLTGRVAFWVAAGIPVAMLATMAVMLLTGQSINMVSLFAMIMALGIVVDDAIVVGEHADAQRRAGLSPLAAAETSAGSMGAPVLASSLTTVAAFLPLFVIGDIIGKIIVAIPYVIVTVIFASLIECFFVLPAHMRAALRGDPGRASRLRDWLDRHFDRFRDGPFRRTVLLAVQWRYATLALSLAALILSIGLVAGARLTFHFFPAPEPDKLYANLQMVAGTPRETTAAMLDEMERALRVAEDRLTEGRGGLVRMAAGHLGMAVGEQDTFRAQGGDEIGGFVVELAPSDERDVRTGAFIEAWKAAILPRPGLEALTVLPAQGGPPGRELDIRLTAADPEALKAASDAVKALIARFPGVSDVKDDLPYGKRETVLTLTPQGQAMGLTTESVARQVRAAYDGAVAMRFPRGDEEVTVRVRYPLADADAGLLERLRLRGPQGAEIALEDAVSRREKQGFARIPREDGSREIAITGEIDDAVTNGDEVLDGLRRAGLFDIAAKYGVSVAFAGKAEEQAQTLGDMRAGGMLGLAMIYIVLAWVFASYLRPLAVMAVIPLGFVGTVIGHLLLGYDLTILSLVALVGLSGILVNDSIILVGTIDARIRGGQPVRKAIVDGTCERLRAVILTSATTIGGLAPLLFEGSFQAQFLIPMAVTMVFGLLVTTLVVLFLVPALIAVQGDVAARFGRQVGAVAQRRRAQEG